MLYLLYLTGFSYSGFHTFILFHILHIQRVLTGSRGPEAATTPLWWEEGQGQTDTRRDFIETEGKLKWRRRVRKKDQYSLLFFKTTLTWTLLRITALVWRFSNSPGVSCRLITYLYLKWSLLLFFCCQVKNYALDYKTLGSISITVTNINPLSTYFPFYLHGKISLCGVTAQMIPVNVWLVDYFGSLSFKIHVSVRLTEFICNFGVDVKWSMKPSVLVKTEI